MFDSVSVLNPVSSAMTVERPVGREGAVNSPLVSATIVRVRPVPSLTMVTLAPGTTEPDESVTVPRIVPLTACAPAFTGEQTATVTKRKRIRTKPPGYQLTRRIMCVLHGWACPILRPDISHPFAFEIVLLAYFAPFAGY